ncbi:MAG: hypothetical protein E3K37_00205 [Candidatus Kuenenia sp.]|nr:hypothetical protein [Candidatus Kuenenia hertensis]
MIADKKLIRDDDELYKLILNEFDEAEKEIKTKRTSQGKKTDDECDITNEYTDDEGYAGNAREDVKALLSEDDQKFIEDTVKWLSKRENKDAIVSRIWDLLVESEPDSFYNPEEKEVSIDSKTDKKE